MVGLMPFTSAMISFFTNRKKIRLYHESKTENSYLPVGNVIYRDTTEILD